MKQILLLAFCSLISIVSAQNTRYESSYYIDGNNNTIYSSNTIILNFDTKVISHTNGLSNYPLKVKDIEHDDKNRIIIKYEPNVTTENYDNPIFKRYGFRGFQLYLDENRQFVGLVEIIKYSNSNETQIIKYKP